MQLDLVDGGAPSVPRTHIRVFARDCNRLMQASAADTGIFLLHNTVPLRRVEIMGICVEHETKANGLVRFTVDDGTGCVPCQLWPQVQLHLQLQRREDAPATLCCDPQLTGAAARLTAAEHANIAALELGALVRVQGRPAIWEQRVQVNVDSYQREHDANSEALFWLDALHAAQCRPLPNVALQSVEEDPSRRQRREQEARQQAIEDRLLGHLQREAQRGQAQAPWSDLQRACNDASSQGAPASELGTSSVSPAEDHMLEVKAALRQLVWRGEIFLADVAADAYALLTDELLRPWVLACLDECCKGSRGAGAWRAAAAETEGPTVFDVAAAMNRHHARSGQVRHERIAVVLDYLLQHIMCKQLPTQSGRIYGQQLKEGKIYTLGPNQYRRMY
ncbi:hypothetical protein CYMTET_26942 [Cymbomonas tetramitiformis]|uniref:CST complex subunit STN1 n=1 Tax=Cymbomonas tetramitiformis TaxID=36881 RepID=A0AAE0FQR3_9CHLO|nr:hypothetical protein CYMTET_26942 [Cymbomonas tetramitiformis]